MTSTSRDPSLRRSVAWTFSGNVIYAACQWGLLSALTKLGTADAVGRFALASAIATPIMMFSKLQLRAVMATDAENDYEFGHYMALRIFTSPLALLVTLCVAIAGYTGDQILAIGLFAAGRLVENFSDIHYGYAQKRERLDLVARSLIIKGVVALVLFAGTFALTRSLLWALTAQLVAWLIPLLAFDIPRVRALFPAPETSPWKPVWSVKHMRSLAFLALPLGFTMLLLQLRHTVPRSLLENAWGEESLGLFAAMAYLILIGNTVVLAVSQSSLARLGRARARGDVKTFRHVVLILVGVGIGVGVAGVVVAALWGRPLLSLLYSPDYAQNNDVFVVIMGVGGLTYLSSLLGGPATAAKAFRSQFFVHGVNILILMIVGPLLIPSRGMMGTALTMGAGALWTVIAYGVIVVRAMTQMGRYAPVSEGETGQ